MQTSVEFICIGFRWNLGPWQLEKILFTLCLHPWTQFVSSSLGLASGPGGGWIREEPSEGQMGYGAHIDSGGAPLLKRSGTGFRAAPDPTAPHPAVFVQGVFFVFPLGIICMYLFLV